MYLLASHPVFSAYQQSDFFGKVIFLSLVILSFYTWFFFIKKWTLYKNYKKKLPFIEKEFEKRQSDLLHVEIPAGNPLLDIHAQIKEQTLQLLQKNRFFSTEKESAVFLSNEDINYLKEHSSDCLHKKQKVLEQGLSLLPMIVSLAPFLGLLGTVWGILLTFNELYAGASVQQSTLIIGGLAMALGTTVCGLLVAIPALIAYYTLKNHLHTLLSDMDHFSHRLLASIEFHYRK